jgi:hypothetical protein
MNNVARNLEVSCDVAFNHVLRAGCLVRSVEAVLFGQFDARNKLFSQFRRRNLDQTREEVGVEFDETVFAFGDGFFDDGFP